MLPSNQVDYTDLDVSTQQGQPSLLPTGIVVPFPSPNTQQARFDYFAAPIVSSHYWATRPNQQQESVTESVTNNKPSKAGKMAHPFPAQGTMTGSMDQNAFTNYSHQQLMSSSYYSSFSILPNQMQMRTDVQQHPQQQQQNSFSSQNQKQYYQQQQQAQQQQQQQQQQQFQLSQAQAQNQQQQQQQQQQQGPSSMMQSLSRQDSVDYDDEYDDDDDDGEEEEEDNSEVMIPKDDIETRLKVAQAAQDAAASEGPNGVFACPYCDKRYAGKHARSIWRRHLQDKHAIPLSQQPRRTRWDGDANRPKNAEERRQRMLESKRRWARKKRQAEKIGVKSNGDDSFGNTSLSDSSFQERQVKRSSSQSATVKKRPAKPKGPQQLKFHNITQSEMPPYADFGGGSSTAGTGGGGMLWPTASNGSFQTTASMGTNRPKATSSSTLSSAHNFNPKNNRGGSQQHTFAMMTSISSPRKALGQLDSNLSKASRMMRQGNGHLGAAASELQQDSLMKARTNATSPQFATLDLSKTTPMNRYSQLYPTPPSVGDPKMSDMSNINNNNNILHEMKMAGKFNTSFENNRMPLLSPPISHHTGESSPSYLGTNALHMAANIAKRNSTSSSVFAPVMPRSEIAGQRSPADNPFSLDRHKISPTTTVQRRSLPDALQPPMSANRLTAALDGGEHKLSPIQNRTLSDPDVKGNASPLEKSRRLPPLVKTPLRPFKVKDEPTPNNATGLLNGIGSVSIRRVRPSGGANGIDSWKSLCTPTEEHSDRMLGGLGTIGGFTPLHAQSAKYSTTRMLDSVTRPSRGSGDQFSSPQHLNLTQSLGLAPHSTGKGLLGSATPYVGHFLTSNSPWPDSVLRPTFKTSSSKRGREEDTKGVETSNDEEEEDEEEEIGEVFIHETPSRPAKHRRSVVLGSEGGSAATVRSRHPSSASREPYPMKPISFNLSSDREEKTTAAAAKENDKQESSLDSDLTGGGEKSSILSTSTSSAGSDDGSDEPQSPTMGAGRRKLL